ncbi:MAG: tetratricopeptide repeat protein [Planctomycetota bacterium]|jgi:tetratricopeptide (TPR) repeat protein
MEPRSATSATASRRLARVAFTGKLASMSRREAASIVSELGGRVTSTVSRLTSLLVVGMDGWPLLPDGAVSRKLRRAEQLRGAGGSLAILSEREFLELVGRSERDAQLRKGYPADRIVELAGIDTETLRRWELLGLVRSADGLYDFQDIVSLRCIARLVRNGVSPSVIGRNVRALADVLPGTERPLAQLSIVVADRGTLLAELGECLVDPGGQLHLNFDAPATREEAPVAPSPFDAEGPAAPDAESWLDRGHAWEEQEEHERAAEAYRKALSIQPHFPEAQFNLGNTLRALGRLEAAEERYRTALEQDPELAEAWYNLADVQEEVGRVAEAAASLAEAVRISPTYADAHFNLAACCEQIGRFDDAARHWRAYLGLDPSSEWAAYARQRLAALQPAHG